MKFEEAYEHVNGIPYMGGDQAWELYQFILREKPKTCLELGHAHGVSSIYIAAALEELGEDHHLDTVDLDLSVTQWDPHVEQLLEKTGLGQYVSVHREANSYTWYLKKKIEAQSTEQKCETCYDFCFIDGPKNWTIDGLAFFLCDKLLNEKGWLLFDDYSWYYKKKLQRKEVTDGITIRAMSDDEIARPHVERIFQLLVRQHSNYSNFEVQDECWGWAQKIADGSKEQKTGRPLGHTPAGIFSPKGKD